MAHDTDDNLGPQDGVHFRDVLAERVRSPSRRDLFWWGALGAATTLLPACGDDASSDDSLPGPDAPDPVPDGPTPDAPDPGPVRPAALGFAAVAKSLADVVTVPPGYEAQVLYALGDPIDMATPAYANDGTDAAATFDKRAGDHHDGMSFFGLDASGAYDPSASNRGLLCMNHEAITPVFLHPAGPTVVDGVRTVADEVRKELFVHGVSIVEIANTGGTWSVVKSSRFNRRIHTGTVMEIGGPLRGHASMVTQYSPAGTRTRGTVNNCANGYTPWGTYLTCEENWAGYFRRVTTTDNPNRTAKELTAFGRYGVAGAGRELWSTVTPDTTDQLFGRWNTMVQGATSADDYRNVVNTFGWVVEIDPFAPEAAPTKRTAMGRFAHEGAWPAPAVAGKPIVFYSGDDSRGEYVYKYVSTAVWDPGDANRTDRMAVGAKYLDDGKLYVARFYPSGMGEWVELAFGKNGISATSANYAFTDQADVALHSRLAADAALATKMDRPEWGAVDPLDGSVYLTMTNNTASGRSLASLDAANPRHYNDPKTVGGTTTPQFGNPNGHIVRWKEASPEATTFMWDVFLFGARAGSPSNVNLSNLTADNDLSSPDGLWFSPASKILWIQTDDNAYTDVTNCMLLAALPGAVGDGATRTVVNVNTDGATREVLTHVGAPLGDKLRRFLVGPKGCEITGLSETPDGKALFVNIQHPGEDTPVAQIATPQSTWPASTAGARPRSATIVITRTDGGIIGV